MRNHFVQIMLFAGMFGLTALKSTAQGCSDAGFCTMGAMKPDQKFHKKLNVQLRSIEISQYVGVTILDETNTATIVDLTVGLSPKNSVQVKLPYAITTGNLGTNQGLGDVSLSYTRNLYSSEQTQFNVTIGAKIPTGNSTKKNDDGFIFPMVYQTTLGSYDMVAGASLISRNWLFATGIQHAFTATENTFVKSSWAGSDLAETATKYPNGNQLIRGTDIMFRVEKNFRFSRFNIHAGLLPIYRINKDKIINPATQQRVEVDKTTGLALSALLGFGYSFNTKSGIKGLLGRRIVERDVNPDGLYREYVATIGYEFRF